MKSSIFRTSRFVANATLSLFGILAVWRWTAVIIAVSLMPTVCRAATYYVSPSGNDSNPGTIDRPWQTLQKAADTVVAGDTVLVQAGTYAGFNTKRDGSSNAPIRFEGVGYPKITTLVNGYNAYNQFVGFSLYTLWLRNGSSGCQVISNRFWNTGENGMAIGQGGSALTPSNVVVAFNSFSNVYYGLFATGRGHVIASNFFYGQTEGDAMQLNASSCRVVGNVVTNWTRPTGSSAHVDIIQAFSSNGEVATNNLIEANWFVNCSGTQMAHLEDQARDGRVSNWTFRNNLYKNVQGTLFTYVPGTRFYNNVFYESGQSTGAALLFRTSDNRNTAHNSGCWNNIFVRCGSTSNSSWSVETGVTNFIALANIVQTLEGGTDPLFVNPTAGTPEGFRLQTNSPCVGVAHPFNELFTRDFAGWLRGREWDIGAFEMQPAIPAELARPPSPVLRVVNGQ